MCPPTLENTYQDGGCFRSALNFRTTRPRPEGILLKKKKRHSAQDQTEQGTQVLSFPADTRPLSA